MRIRIDPMNEVPIYRQITEQVRHMILSGQMEAHEKLPSSRNLGLELKVNMLTVQKAYKELREEGLIYNRRGEGSFVQDQQSIGPVARTLEIRKELETVVNKARLYGLTHEEVVQLLKKIEKENQS